MLRLLGPDEMTPTARRQLQSIAAQWRDEDDDANS